MSRRRGERPPGKAPRAAPSGPSISAADFKARCLELMDRVRETGTEYIVTKHGRPVARLVPYTAPRRGSLFGALKGSVLGYDRPLEPIEGEWDTERD